MSWSSIMSLDGYIRVLTGILGPGRVYDGPRLVTKGLGPKVSTTRSDEDSPLSGSTLSFPILVFYPFWPDIVNLALNLEYRKEHVCAGSDKTAVPAVRYRTVFKDWPSPGTNNGPRISITNCRARVCRVNGSGLSPTGHSTPARHCCTAAPLTSSGMHGTAGVYPGWSGMAQYQYMYQDPVYEAGGS